jgi:hypothetical protein
MEEVYFSHTPRSDGSILLRSKYLERVVYRTVFRKNSLEDDAECRLLFGKNIRIGYENLLFEI